MPLRREAAGHTNALVSSSCSPTPYRIETTDRTTLAKYSKCSKKRNIDKGKSRSSISLSASSWRNGKESLSSRGLESNLFGGAMKNEGYQQHVRRKL